MSEYQRLQVVEARAKDVFDYLARAENLSDYLPHVQAAEATEPGRVRIQGVRNGHEYTSEGYFRSDPQRLRIEWGSDDADRYHGWLEIRAGDTSHDLSEVTLLLHFDDKHDFLAQQGPDPDDAMQEQLAEALDAIRTKVEPADGRRGGVLAG